MSDDVRLAQFGQFWGIVGQMYGGQDFPSVTHEADQESVFVIEVAKRALLCVVYRDHEAPGLITRWTRGAANRITTQYDKLVEATAL